MKLILLFLLFPILGFSQSVSYKVDIVFDGTKSCNADTTKFAH